MIGHVHWLGTLDAYEMLLPEREEDFDVLRTLDGTPRRRTWRPIPVRIVHREHGKRLLPADTPRLSSNSLALTEHAVQVIGPRLERWGEILPLVCPEKPLYVFNATAVIDALDEDASDIVRFPDGRIMTIRRHVFLPARIGDAEVFRLPQYPRPIFTTDAFQGFVASTDVTGLAFRKVWEASAGP